MQEQNKSKITMLSLLIISEKIDMSNQYALEICAKEKIDKLDIIFLEYEESIGVEEIREMQKKIYLKPFKGEKKGIIISNAHTTTREAQNALLKQLEEPPINTQIILTATTLQFFLPTVISRCKIIDLNEKKEELSQEEEIKYQEEFETILSADIGQKLKIAQEKSADKQQMQIWLTHIIHALRTKMLATNSYELTKIIYEFQETLNKLQTTNINPRMLLENLFLNLPKNY